MFVTGAPSTYVRLGDLHSVLTEGRLLLIAKMSAAIPNASDALNMDPVQLN